MILKRRLANKARLALVTKINHPIARLFSLVSRKIAQRREFAAVAIVLPASQVMVGSRLCG